MISNYLFYLNTLPRTEKNKQLFIILIFFLILFALCGLLEFLRYKFKSK